MSFSAKLPFELSVLDFGIIAPGRSGREVLADSLELADRLDQLRYHRLWLSEHHEPHFCWTGPEVMVAALAQRTRRIRLGTAAVLLPLRNPLQLAECFRTLEALTPGRIDLGVCAGIPQDPAALTALTGAAVAEPAGFAKGLTDLMAYLYGRFPADHRFARGATPCFVPAPPVWVMGSGFGSARLAAEQGAGYAYSLFHRGSKLEPAVTRLYRDEAERSGTASRVAIAASCICAPTGAEAAAQRQLVEGWLKDDMRVVIAGTPDECHEQVVDMADEYGADEVILFHLWHQQAPRLAAVEALADLFQLTGDKVPA
jgi:luciferase family oxidoreductase group 1